MCTCDVKPRESQQTSVMHRIDYTDRSQMSDKVSFLSLGDDAFFCMFTPFLV